MKFYYFLFLIISIYTKELFYLNYLNIDEELKNIIINVFILLFLKNEDLFNYKENENIDYVIQSICINKENFQNNFDEKIYISGINIPTIIIHTSLNKIKEYFNNNNECLYKYEILHPLIKV